MNRPTRVAPSPQVTQPGDKDEEDAAELSHQRLRSLRAVLDGDPAVQEFARVGDEHYIVRLEPGSSPNIKSEEALAALDPSIHVEIVKATISRAVLEDARHKIADVVSGLKFQGGESIGFGIDFTLGLIRITGGHELVQNVLTRSGVDRSLIYEEGGVPPTRTSGLRAFDASPHYGGALYALWAQGNCIAGCSTGFRGHNIFGVNMVLTAGHCGQAPLTGWSGPFLEGIIYRSNDYPLTDAAVLYYPTESYDNYVYADPDRSVRHIPLADDAIVGEVDCSDGAVTFSQCSAVVLVKNWTWGDSEGVTSHLIYYGGAYPLAQGGDSGGPVYWPSPTSSSGVAIGIIVAGGAGFGGGWWVMYAQDMYSIQTYAGITVW